MAPKPVLIRLFSMIVMVVLASTLQAADETTAPRPSLYERLGGEPAIQAVVDDFVVRTMANPYVNFTRKGTSRAWEATPENVARLKKHLVQFFCVTTGSHDHIYEGQYMKTAHEGMGISSAEFDALTGDLTASLNQLKVPLEEQKVLMAIVRTMKEAVVENA